MLVGWAICSPKLPRGVFESGAQSGLTVRFNSFSKLSGAGLRFRPKYEAWIPTNNVGAAREGTRILQRGGTRQS